MREKKIEEKDIESSCEGDSSEIKTAWGRWESQCTGCALTLILMSPH
jgi:hypothetical protein